MTTLCEVESPPDRPAPDEDLATFAERCERFLARYPARVDDGDEPVRWGVGSDRVAVFEESDPEVEGPQIEAVRSWRRDLDDAGLAWISGPVEHGGAGLSREHERGS